MYFLCSRSSCNYSKARSKASSQEICSHVGAEVPLGDVRRIGCVRRSEGYSNSAAAFPLGQSFSPLGWLGNGSIRRNLSFSTITSHPQRERHCVQNAGMRFVKVIKTSLRGAQPKHQPHEFLLLWSTLVIFKLRIAKKRQNPWYFQGLA